MTLWYVARGTGLAALVLLSTTTTIGALMSGRGKAERRVVWSYVHRVTASLGLAVMLVHLTTILADSYAHVGWVGALVPFTSGYRPTWVALGTLSVYTFLFVAAIGYARGRIAASERGAHVWRGLHCLGYAGWASAMLHGFNSGSDSGLGWVQLLYIGCGAAVPASVAVRLGLACRPDLVRRGVAPRKHLESPVHSGLAGQR